MKIAPFCLVLALLSPVAALRGDSPKRKLQDEDGDAQGDGTAVDTDGTAGDAVVVDPSLPFNFNDLTPPPTDPPADSEGEGGDEQEEVTTDYGTVDKEDKDNWDDAEKDVQGDDAAKHKSEDDGDSGDGGSLPVDGLCSSFCRDYLVTCSGANAFFEPDDPRGSPARRLIAGDEPELKRLSGSVFDAAGDCERACAGYPRPKDPATYKPTSYPATDDVPSAFGPNAIGDTFWCRRTHLTLAAQQWTFAAQEHCPAAGPSGGGICSNAEIYNPLIDENATAYEFIRAGADTARHIGYCQMYYNDFVADCTGAGITDRLLSLALANIPIETRVIILNNNIGKFDQAGVFVEGGITKLENQIFRNLMCPECIHSLIIDDGIIETVGETAFTSLVYLQQLSLNMQLITTLPGTLINNNILLKEFSMFNTPTRTGGLTSIPTNFFRFNPFLTRLVISGHRDLKDLANGCVFCNALPNDRSVMEVLILSNNGLTNAGMPPGMFNNMGELEVLDLSYNQFTVVNEGWFSAGWAHSLRTIYFQGNPINIVPRTSFDTIKNLETVLMHDTDVSSIPIAVFDNNPKLITYTTSPKLS